MSKSMKTMEDRQVAIWGYLEDNGPTMQKKISLDLKIQQCLFPSLLFGLDEFIEKFTFKGGARRGSTKYPHFYGSLSRRYGGVILCTKNDPRLIDYILERIDFTINNKSDAATAMTYLRKHIGYERARRLIEKTGYIYRTTSPLSDIPSDSAKEGSE